MRGWRAQLVLLALLASALSCARIKPPSGGPVDDTPATLLRGRPADGTRNTGPLEEVSLVFSEPVERGSVLEALHSDPPRLLRSVQWSGDTLLALRFWEPLDADVSMDVYLTPGWKDRHRVAQGDWQVMSFATGDTLRPGWLAGRATFKGESSRSLHLALQDSSVAVLRRLRPDARGDFVIRRLPADGRELELVGFQDVNGDSVFTPGVDFADTLRDSLRLTPAVKRRFGLKLDVIDPDEPGTIAGSFACLDTLPGAFFLQLLPDSFRLADGARPTGPLDQLPAADLTHLRWTSRWQATADSLAPAGLRMDAEGAYEFASVPPGDWWLFVFKDLGGGDSLWNPADEPAGLNAGPLRLAPGGAVTVPRLAFPVLDDAPGARHGGAP